MIEPIDVAAGTLSLSALEDAVGRWAAAISAAEAELDAIVDEVATIPKVCAWCRRVFYKPGTVSRWVWAGERRCCSRSCASTLRNRARNTGGLFQGYDGRWRIACRDRTVVLYYRAVMEAELRRSLHRDEVVHHVNGDHTDDRPENLRVMSRSAHRKLHAAETRAALKAWRQAQ